MSVGESIYYLSSLLLPLLRQKGLVTTLLRISAAYSSMIRVRCETGVSRHSVNASCRGIAGSDGVGQCFSTNLNAVGNAYLHHIQPACTPDLGIIDSRFHLLLSTLRHQCNDLIGGRIFNLCTRVSGT